MNDQTPTSETHGTRQPQFSAMANMGGVPGFSPAKMDGKGGFAMPPQQADHVGGLHHNNSTFVPLPASIITHEQALRAGYELRRVEAVAAEHERAEWYKRKAIRLRRELDASDDLIRTLGDKVNTAYYERDWYQWKLREATGSSVTAPHFNPYVRVPGYPYGDGQSGQAN